METPRYELEGRLAEVLAATVFALVAGLLLWPPGAVYWTGVADALGENATLAIVAGLAAGLGAWFGRTSRCALVHLVVGGLVAYGAGMAAIAAVVEPDSPAHLVWYGVLLACLAGGAMLWVGVRRIRLAASE